MDIARIGHAAFRLRGRDASVVMDPAPSSTGFRLNRPQADVVTVSNGAEAHSWITGVAGDPRSLTGPGEYEIKNVLVTGVPTPGPTANGESESSQNIAFKSTRMSQFNARFVRFICKSCCSPYKFKLFFTFNVAQFINQV